MAINHKKIKELIANASVLCPKAKQFVTNLMVETVGYKPPKDPKPKEPKVGEIWENNTNHNIYLIVPSRSSVRLGLLLIQSILGGSSSGIWETSIPFIHHNFRFRYKNYSAYLNRPIKT